MTVSVEIQETPIDAQALRAALPDLPECGGFCSFEGLIRHTNEGKSVTHLEYEAYEALALSELEKVCLESREKFGVKYARVVHRTGRLAIGDVAVVIQVLSKHRDEAFKACRYVIDELKHRVPIWKREHYKDHAPKWTRCTHSGPQPHKSDYVYPTGLNQNSELTL